MEQFVSDAHFQPKEELTRILDRAHNRFQDEREDVDAALDYITAGLAAVRNAASEFWAKDGLRMVGEHAVRAYLHHDPLTGRAFRKPRGYPGDAVLLDLIYEHSDGREVVETATDIGKHLYRATRNGRSCRAVRTRLDLLANKIDEVTSRLNCPRILSVACGHLREAERSKAISDCNYSEFVALDQDPESLALVATRWKNSKIVPTPARLSRLLKGRTHLGNFDLIYAAGIYDYLDATVATQLTAYLFSQLNSGGELYIANFLSGAIDTAYMESIMDWWLIYRSLREIDAVASGIPQAQIAAYRSYEDDLGVIGYLSLIRA